ncbi:type I site-specific deoxyribonuclease, HsdR family protein [Mycoplasma wenyonii str. Massachusetts]|uniref:Type I restriction enzyme endonuclease subunit n=1 Tax=Mycoplasma wenyonii (strain Massachusetts) TaxID=1197325 RepID=I6ZFB0_MYCWM|nr:HsdR family type I site-specific deoxyribonuclease [Mycoplasma wenyonii]AFN65282.1 type I site-specific deoxyribonuclease, HsdR family protein [Mycoplasma wenyonii str. Massachusetts]
MDPENTRFKPTTEEELEDYIVSLFETQGYLYSRGNELKRESYSEVFLLEDLTNFLKPKYPKLDTYFGVYSDIRHIADDLQREDKNFYDFNKDFFKKLNNGITYRRERDGEVFSISLIDFQVPENNILRVVNQLSVDGKTQRRVDIVIYINGIPFIVWELKSPSDTSTGLTTAHNQLQTYQKEIPELFKYNAFAVLCDGIGNVEYGVSWEKKDRFVSWKRISEFVNTKEKDLLDITIAGLFNKERLIKVIEDFIWFSDDNQQQKKVICRYPQFYGALKMLKSIESNLKPEGSGKGGIYFGSTGCGKSYTMLFLSRLLLKSKLLNKPSILLIADRVEISEQLCKLFQSSTDFLQDKNVKEIKGRAELSNSLKTLTVGGVFITNIQKFEESIEPLSNRNNIICISDEAHRSQHNFDVEFKESGGETVPFAKRLHESLPNATYVGFTATPIDKTMDVFGEIVDKYTMDESINDGFTVQLLLDSRRGWLSIQDEIVNRIIEKYEEARNAGASAEKIEEDQKIRSQLRAISGIQERIEKITKDIVEHYEERLRLNETVCGKAMIVANGRENGYSIYKEMEKLRPEWFKNESDSTDSYSKVHLVMTRTEKDLKRGDEEMQKDMKRMYDLIGNERYQRELARVFKDSKSNFKIAIVSDKWLTGFDVPCLDIMYLDRIFQDKALIQAVSRVNRKYMRKSYGRIVSYWPIEGYWKEALKKVGGGERGGKSLEEIISKTRDKLELLNKLFYDFKKEDFLEMKEEEQSQTVINYVEGKGEEFKAQFADLYKQFIQLYDSWSNAELSRELGDDRAFYKLVWKYWSRSVRKSWTPISDITKQEIAEQMRNVFKFGDMTQYSFGYLNVSFPPEKEYKNKEITREEKLNKARSLGEALYKAYKFFGKNFLEKLAKLQEKYETLWSEQQKLEAIEDPEERKRAMDEFRFEEKLEALDRQRDELVDAGYKKIKEHESKDWTREEQIFFDLLTHFNNQFQFGFSTDKLLEINHEIHRLWDEIKEFVGKNIRHSMAEKLKMNLYSLIDKYHFYDKDENYSETTVVIIEELLDCFKKMSENAG